MVALGAPINTSIGKYMALPALTGQSVSVATCDQSSISVSTCVVFGTGSMDEGEQLPGWIHCVRPQSV